MYGIRNVIMYVRACVCDSRDTSTSRCSLHPTPHSDSELNTSSHSDNRSGRNSCRKSHTFCYSQHSHFRLSLSACGQPAQTSSAKRTKRQWDLLPRPAETRFTMLAGTTVYAVLLLASTHLADAQ